MPGHESRVATMAWNQSTLSSGSRTGQIIHHDVRIANHVMSVVNAHNQVRCSGVPVYTTAPVRALIAMVHFIVQVYCALTAPVHFMVQEVCGLAWNSNCRTLASGGNDNIVNIWDGRSPTPLFSLPDHQAAVKVRYTTASLTTRPKSRYTTASLTTRPQSRYTTASLTTRPQSRYTTASKMNYS